MNKSNKFSPEVRERAVRMVQEHRGEYPSRWAAVESDAGTRSGVTTSDAQRMKELEREVKKLRRANDILKLARVSSTRQCNMIHPWHGLIRPFAELLEHHRQTPQ